MNKEKYDLIVPIGASCKPAFYLRECGLRKYAYPFDWQLNTLDGVIRLFRNDFDDFFENYSDVSDYNDRDIDYMVIKDNKNDIRCMHYVFTDDDIDEQVSRFIKLMKKRYARLKKHFEKANSILIVSDFLEEIDDLKRFVMVLSKKFPGKKIKLIRKMSSLEYDDITEYVISDCLSVVEYRFNDENIDGWTGNYDRWMELLSHFELNS